MAAQLPQAPKPSSDAKQAADVFVEVRGVSKNFGATRALADVGLSIGRGEVHCLLGENGAGKSTLGRILGGLYQPEAGQILVDGEPVSFRKIADARTRGIALVHQELSLAPDLSVRENLCLGTERARSPLSRLRHRAEKEACRALLVGLGLGIDLDKRTGDLPAANQQLIEIAKALLLRPRLVIMDEPTSMLGAVEKGRLFDVLRRSREEGTTFIFITHHIEDVFEVGDRVSIMKDGALVASFPVDGTLDPDRLLELLAGRKITHVSTAPRIGKEETFLQISGLATKAEGAKVDLTIARGEIVGIYGVVGCGRELIAQALVGMVRMDGVALILDGRPYRPASVADAGRQGVGYLPAGRAQNCILPSRSIRENLMLTRLGSFRRGALLFGTEESKVADQLLRQLGVKYSTPEAPITSLSGGNQQKSVLGRAFGRGTRLLVLEDPTAGIDVGAKFDIHNQIREKATEGISVVLFSSDMVETLTLCHSVYTVHGGRVVRKYHRPSLDDQPSVVSDVLGRSGSS